MSIIQRTILIAGGVFMLLAAFVVSESYEGDKWLSTAQFALAVAMFYWSARRG